MAFTYEGNRREGVVNRITRRATVLVEDASGELFNDGKRYAQYDASTDKLAAYGLAALVGGVAAKKLGLLALAGVFFAKFFKVIAIGVVAAGAVLRKFFARKA